MKDNNKKIARKTSLKFKIRSFFNQGFLGNNIIRGILIALAVLDIVNWIAIAVFIDSSRSYSVILHYNVYFGVDLIGEWRQAYLAPAVATALTLLNIFLARRFYEKKERIASYILLIASIMIQLSSAIAVASVILINY